MRSQDFFLLGCLALLAPHPGRGQEADRIEDPSLDELDDEEEGARAPRPGALSGIILDAESEGRPPVEGALIQVLETNLEARSGADGSFRIEGLTPGQHTVQVSKEGIHDERAPVVIEPASDSEIVILVYPEEREAIIVKVRVVKREGRAVAEKQQGRSAQTGFDRAQLKQSTESDVAGVAKSLPGVSTVDSKYVYVRGLGERYSQTLLNGSVIPSPEPDKRVVPLDLFPTNLLEGVNVVKTYSPDMPGEFSGGSVQIETVRIPERPFFNVGLDLKYRQGTTFRDFNTYHGGNLDRFSFDDGTRELPGEVPGEEIRPESPGQPGYTPEQIQDIGRSFANIWDVQSVTAPLDHKVAMSFGERWGKKEANAGSFGITGALNWSNKYQRIDDEAFRVAGGANDVLSDFKLDTSTFEAELSALLNLTYEINTGQTVGVRNLYTRSAEDQVRIQTGRQDGRQEPVEITRLRWVERSLFSTQPFGEHLLAGDTFLEWRVSYSLSQREEPDNRQVLYEFDPGVGDFTFRPGSNSGQRDYYILDENIYDGAIDYSIPFNPFDIPDKDPDPDRLSPLQKIKLGPAVVYRDRDLDARRFRFDTPGGTFFIFDEFGQPIDFRSPAEELFQNKNITPDAFFLDEVTRPTDSYEATQLILAGYGLLDVRVHRDVRIEVGARVESSDQIVTSRQQVGGSLEEVETKLDDTDVLPSVNGIWEFYEVIPEDPLDFRERMQLRLGASHTVSRPEFRELAPFEYNEVLGGTISRGNPNLQSATIWNFDLGYEWYPSEGDLVGAGLFYKLFDQPIETTQLASSGGIIQSWENADEADLFGFEIETRKSLGFVGDWIRGSSGPEAEGAPIVTPPPAPPPSGMAPLVPGEARRPNALDDLTVVANFSWIKSEVLAAKGDPNSPNLQTNERRPLQGQSPYLFNFGLVYDNDELGIAASVFANTFGERISGVGTSGLEDEVELPRWTLDASISKKFGKATLRFTAENILDYPYEFEREDVTTRKYRRGRTFGLGIAFSF